MDLSVIICCYNSRERIGHTIMHLAKQIILNNIRWELVIVDNNCTDETTEFVKNKWNELTSNCIPLNIYYEQQPGLLYARMKGVSVAKGEILVFCDDDNWLSSNYINDAYNIMIEKNDIGALGGQSVAISDIALPNWWEEFCNGYAVGKQNSITGYVNKRGYLWGAGIVTRKKLFLQAFNSDFPSILTGRKANKLSSGDDAEFCARLLLMNYNLYYSDKLFFNHYIPINRLTEEYRNNIFNGHKDAFKILKYYYYVINNDNRSIWKKGYGMAKSLFLFLVKKVINDKINITEALNLLYIDTSWNFIPTNPKEIKEIVRFKKYYKYNQSIN